MNTSLETIWKEFQAQLAETKTQAEVANVKAEFLGKKGRLKEILKSLKDATPEERKEIGGKSNEMKVEMEAAVHGRLQELELEEINSSLEKNWKDTSLRESIMDRGLTAAGYHPTTKIRREVEDIFRVAGRGYVHVLSVYPDAEYHFRAPDGSRAYRGRDYQLQVRATDEVDIGAPVEILVEVRRGTGP